MEGELTLATLVREHMEISRVEFPVYKSVSMERRYRNLGVVMANALGWRRNKTYLGRVGKSVSLKETVKTLGVEVTLRIATETWRGDLGVGEISPMAT